MLCRIAHNPAELAEDSETPANKAFITSAGSELFRSAMVAELSDHVGRDEQFFSLFQVPELSQPI
jgi:hypothetical protein